ncbi:NUDIX domain-containing protein [Alicyclobacillus sp. ALC3]|nr:NUDIX domain-containing protein [Alicyclobacillus sp. ALC3]
MIHVDWDGHHVKLTWYPMKQISDSMTVTSVQGYCFNQNKVVLVNVRGRGFNTPGGHIENGETIEEAFHREVLEEASVRGEIHYLGVIEVSHEGNPLFVAGGKYPLVGYQAFYRMDIRECLPFRETNETSSRIWVEPELVKQVINDHELSLLVLQQALKRDECLSD